MTLNYQNLIFSFLRVPSNVEAFFNTENSISDQRVISIGETTRKELLKHNVNSEVPWQSYELAMLDLILAN